MIWFAWRQFRLQAMVVAAVLVAIGVLFLLTGPSMLHLFDTTVVNCRANNDCGAATTILFNKYNKLFQFMTSFSLIVPALLGIFWGAPLIARELETGTYRLAWTQGITRARWMVIKLAVVGGASMIVAGLLSWMLTWWASPLDTTNQNRFGSLVYDTHYITPIGYAAFAFALGATAGVLWRRTLPAMATTIVAYVAARLTFTSYVRSHLMSPVMKIISIKHATNFGFSMTPSGGLQFIAGNASYPNSLVVKSIVVGRHGAAITSHWLKVHCPKLVAPPPNTSVGKVGPTGPRFFNACVNKISESFHIVMTYQPASRFWTFQWYETSIFVLAGVALCAFSVWWVRRRVA
jgi:ABC-type transport system involved in multi-copper enzyme maturation permease subunit